MFDDTNLPGVDVSVLDLSNATNISCMFHRVSNLNFEHIQNYNVSNVTSMEGMFYDVLSRNNIGIVLDPDYIDPYMFIFWKSE